jgi:hypothetical protein
VGGDTELAREVPALDAERAVGRANALAPVVVATPALLP